MSQLLENLALCWLARPLRRSYAYMLISCLPFDCKDVNFDQTAIWALGCQSDGGMEIVGLWLPIDGAPAALSEIWSNLRFRGVERIGAVLSSPSVSAHLRASMGEFEGCRRIDPVSPQEAELDVVAPMQIRRPLVSLCTRSLSVAAETVQRILSRAISRHGVFPNVDEAEIFLADALASARRRRSRGVGTALRQKSARCVFSVSALPSLEAKRTPLVRGST